MSSGGKKLTIAVYINWHHNMATTRILCLAEGVMPRANSNIESRHLWKAIVHWYITCLRVNRYKHRSGGSLFLLFCDHLTYLQYAILTWVALIAGLDTFVWFWHQEAGRENWTVWETDGSVVIKLSFFSKYLRQFFLVINWLVSITEAESVYCAVRTCIFIIFGINIIIRGPR